MKRLAVVLMACALAAGCTRSNMDSQPKYHEYERGPLFRNGRVLQEPVPGTVARGDLDRARQATEKPAMTAALLARGREQYDVFCSPCHDRAGTGEGIVVQRGFPRPASLHDDRQRALADQHIYDVITNGFGAMYAHGDRVPPRDRWAIVAYVRALQLSQHTALADLPATERSRLTAEPKP
jgi:mono/diheme cytochrome c family protein